VIQQRKVSDMEVKKYTATPIGDGRYKLGESPFYDSEMKRFSWVDILDGKLYISYESGINKSDIKAESSDMGQHIGAAIPMQGKDGFIIAGYDGLYTFESGKKSLLKSMKDEFKYYQRCNDAKQDPKGRLYFGSSVDNSYDIKPHGNLYMFDEGNVTILERNTGISNGMAWNSACDKFYFSDSEFNAVFRYDYDISTGLITNREEFFSVTDKCPDGMCIDKNDNLWVAVWGGRRVECHDGSTGELIAVIEVDAQNVTSCCFYGANMDSLFITTAGDGLNGKYDGSLFVCTVDL